MNEAYHLSGGKNIHGSLSSVACFWISQYPISLTIQTGSGKIKEHLQDSVHTEASEVCPLSSPTEYDISTRPKGSGTLKGIVY